MKSLTLILPLLLVAVAQGLISPKPVSVLLQENAAQIAALKSLTTETVGSIADEPYSNDVFYLRYCLEIENVNERKDQLKRNLAWRSGPGKAICDAAVAAVAKAQQGGGWNNAVVMSAAPHSASIQKYLTPSNMLTTTSSQGDLVYCVRAGKINDAELMNAVSIEALTDFFVYAKEVNALVSMQRSLDSNRMICVITANDLSGINLIGGSADFRKALSASSKQAADLYPATNGPSLILNLPALLSALVKLFTPLFPEAVRKRIKFENGPLKNLSSLEQVASSRADDSPERAAFLKDLDTIVYSS